MAPQSHMVRLRGYAVISMIVRSNFSSVNELSADFNAYSCSLLFKYWMAICSPIASPWSPSERKWTPAKLRPRAALEASLFSSDAHDAWSGHAHMPLCNETTSSAAVGSGLQGVCTVCTFRAAMHESFSSLAVCVFSTLP